MLNSERLLTDQNMRFVSDEDILAQLCWGRNIEKMRGEEPP